MVRVGPDAYEDAVNRPIARVMDFTGSLISGSVYVSQEGISSAEAVTEWVDLGVAFADTLPRREVGGDQITM